MTAFSIKGGVPGLVVRTSAVECGIIVIATVRTLSPGFADDWQMARFLRVAKHARRI